MKIKAKIDRLVNGGSIKAIASVTLDSWYVVKNLRVVDGSKGLFVACPQESYTDKDGSKKYSNASRSDHRHGAGNEYSSGGSEVVCCVSR